MKAKEMVHWKGVWKITDNFDTWTTFDRQLTVICLVVWSLLTISALHKNSKRDFINFCT